MSDEKKFTVRILRTHKRASGHFEEGEVRVLSEVDARYVCALGWAEDTEGVIPTGEYKEGVSRITPESVMLDLQKGATNG